jgi:hypothetical protein
MIREPQADMVFLGASRLFYQIEIVVVILGSLTTI